MKVVTILCLLFANISMTFIFNASLFYALEITWFQGLALLAYHLTEV